MDRVAVGIKGRTLPDSQDQKRISIPVYCRIVGLSAPLGIIPGPCPVGDPSEAWCSVAARGRYGEVASAPRPRWGRYWGSWF